MIWTLAFWKGAGERAIKTFAQSFLAAVGVNTSVSLGQVDWRLDASIAATATILSLFFSIGAPGFTAGAAAAVPAPAVLPVTVPAPAAKDSAAALSAAGIVVQPAAADTAVSAALPTQPAVEPLP